jgi:hypothetical protein
LSSFIFCMIFLISFICLNSLWALLFVYSYPL